MKVEIIGDAKEIAALVLAVQERQAKTIVETTDWAGNVTYRNGRRELKGSLFNA